jgi:SAM-dependent methyltransferase
MPALEGTPPALPRNLRRALRDSLLANHLEPRLLYATPGQAERWRRVARRHAPVHRRPAFRRLYAEAFARAAVRLADAPRISLVGLGCGTGEKEAQLAAELRRPGRVISFSAIDASANLMGEATRRLAAAGALSRGHRVGDLADFPAWRKWLGRRSGTGPRVVTLFGMVPNFPPSILGPLLRAALRPGDLLLASVHLAPAKTESPAAIAAAMRRILPQYDNPETLAWLNHARTVWGLGAQITAPKIRIGEIEQVPAFIGEARWKAATRPEPLRLFYSLRYTSQLFEAMLRRGGWKGELLAITPCRQEAIWSIRLPGK